MSWPDAEELSATHARMQSVAQLLRLPLARRTWRGQSGNFSGSGAGSSIDFQDHRPYLPGDDPRHIDWQAYARTGHYTMKLYREEVSPRVDLVLDASESMFFDPQKRTRSCELLYFAAESAWQAGASLRTFSILGNELIGHATEQLLAYQPPAHQENASALDPPRLERVPWRTGSLRVLISDLLFRGSPSPPLLALSAGKGEGVVLAPFCQEEAEPAWRGNIEFIDCEARNSRHQRVEPDLLTRYNEAYTRHFGLWREQCRKYGVTMARVPAEGLFDEAVRFEALVTGALDLR